MPEVVPDDGEAPVIVSLVDAAVHMYSSAIDTLPDPSDPEYGERVAVVLSGRRKLESAISKAAGRSRVTPSVIVALSGVRHRYDDLMKAAANSPSATLGQRLYTARRRARLTAQETANGAGLKVGFLTAIESEEPVTEDEAAKIKDLIAALGG